MAEVAVLIPTRDRPEALTTTLASLCFQEHQDFEVMIANQGDRRALANSASLRSIRRLLALRGRQVRMFQNLPPLGMAQQRQFLLELAESPFVLFLDDDVLLEPFVLKMLVEVIKREDCGFAGNALIGLSFRRDVRPHEQAVEFWESKVEPELVTPDSPEWERHRLHNGANVLHLQQRLNVTPATPRAYKVAWVGGCVLYDSARLREAGGFEFWRDLPPAHCGEDVLAQIRVMRRFGGCGVLPSGAYHQELPTTIKSRKINAPEWLEA